MDIYLAECFKDYCNKRLKELIDSSYIRINNLFAEFEKDEEVIIVCEIFAPKGIFNQLKMYEARLFLIGDLLGIDSLHIIPIEKVHLVRLKRLALMTNNLESWRTYLELQYLL